jgi:hypothetical protein
MTRVSLLVLAVAASFAACALDWDTFDPRLATTTTNSSSSGGGGGGGVTNGSGGSTSSSNGSGATGGTGGSSSSTGGAGGGGGAGGALPTCNGDVVPLLTNGASVTGNTVMAPTQLAAVCAGTTGGERVFAFVLANGADVTVTTELPGTNYDVVQYVREVCEDSTTELSCDDPGAGDTHVLPALPAGTYFVIVDSHSTTQEGDFELMVSW